MTEFSQWGKLTDYPTTQGVTSPDTYGVSAPEGPAVKPSLLDWHQGRNEKNVNAPASLGEIQRQKGTASPGAQE